MARSTATAATSATISKTLNPASIPFVPGTSLAAAATAAAASSSSSNGHSSSSNGKILKGAKAKAKAEQQVDKIERSSTQDFVFEILPSNFVAEMI